MHHNVANPQLFLSCAGQAATEQQQHNAAKTQDARGQGAIVTGRGAPGKKVDILCRSWAFRGAVKTFP